MRGICTHSICCAQSHSNTRRPPLSSKRACSAPNLSSEWVAGSGFVFNGLDAHQSSLACYLGEADRKSTRLNSSHSQISYAAFCLKRKNHVSAKVANFSTHHTNNPILCRLRYASCSTTKSIFSTSSASLCGSRFAFTPTDIQRCAC